LFPLNKARFPEFNAFAIFVKRFPQFFSGFDFPIGNREDGVIEVSDLGF
jgi:hypothetical protein